MGITPLSCNHVINIGLESGGCVMFCPRMILSRLALVVVFLFSPLAIRAAVWESKEFGVAVTLPDGADWVPMPEVVTPTVRVLTAVTNQKTNSMFSFAVQKQLAGKAIDNPILAEKVKDELVAAGYQIFGYSKMSAGTTQWIQFPVNGNGAKGVVRVTEANGQIFTVTMLRGDGKSALEDADLMRAGASFRILPPASQAAFVPAKKPEPPKAGEVTAPATVAAPVQESGMDYKRLAISGGVLVVLLLLAWGIVGSGKK